MSSFSVQVELAGERTGPFIPAEAVVDTGAFYSYLPAVLVNELGIVPTGRRRFGLADGSFIERQIGDVFVRIGDEVHSTICTLGEENVEMLLGAVTLEEFSLGVDPVNQRLVPMTKLPLL